MSVLRRNPLILNLLVISVTIVFVAVTLIAGRAMAVPEVSLTVGSPAPQTYEATRFIAIPDEAATEAARNRAEINTPPVYTTDLTVENTVRRDLAAFFNSIREVAYLGSEDAASVDTSTTTTEAATTTTTAGEGDTGETTTTVSTTTTLPPTTTTTLPRRELQEQIDLVVAEYPAFGVDAVGVFIELYNLDLDRVAEGAEAFFADVELQVRTIAEQQLQQGIRSSEITDVRNEVLTRPSPLFIPGVTDAEFQARIDEAAARVVAFSLIPNESIDEEATAIAREAERARVSDVTVQYFAGQPIVQAGESVTAVELDAIEQLGLLTPEAGTSRAAIALLGAIAVLLTAFFLWRIAPGQWSEPKHFALLGVLLVLAAAASRVPEVVVTDSNPPGYLIPAVMFGYLAAILYNPRTAVLMSFPVATFTAISSADLPLTVFAAGATVAPVSFVSSVSSRRELRVAVALSAAVLAPLAGSIAWVFTGRDAVPEAAAFGLLGGVVAGLVAQGLLSFLENLFRVTTTLTLLDLTDRNHPALRLLEEKAPGTFNHSIMVGTLAGKAARAIGANPLLAQAAAYYHDLGKTENPQYYIENQFGVSNPHDELEPDESARIIRAHVTDGLRLARQFRIPTDVAAGIRMHHGTGLMRYFYHKAIDQDASVDPVLFRHAGEKPKRKEMAIVMVSDAVEGAARALAQHEDPTADSLKKVVDSVVGEKLEDGQLDESDLTFGDLTLVKQAIVGALIGYYHTRIPYPGFPGTSPEAG